MEAAVGLSVGGRAGASAAVLIWRLASFYGIFILGPLEVWLIHRSPPTTTPRGEFANPPRPETEQPPLTARFRGSIVWETLQPPIIV